MFGVESFPDRTLRTSRRSTNRGSPHPFIDNSKTSEKNSATDPNASSAPGHVPPSQLAGNPRMVPMIDNPMFAEQRIEECRTITGGIDIGNIGLAMVVGENGISAATGVPEKLAMGRRPNRRHGKIAIDRVGVMQDNALYASISFQPSGRDSG